MCEELTNKTHSFILLSLRSTMTSNFSLCVNEIKNYMVRYRKNYRLNILSQIDQTSQAFLNIRGPRLYFTIFEQLPEIT
jgi:predicted proteasome-type protease